MEVEMARCECCGLKEDCTQDYIREVKGRFDGKWLCGLCSQAVSDEIDNGKVEARVMEEALIAHMTFCRKFRLNPAVEVADGMKKMLRKRSGEMSSSSVLAKSYSRSASSSRLGSKSSLPLY